MLVCPPLTPPRRPWILGSCPYTCAAGSTWDWWVGGVPAGARDPLDDLKFLRSVILDFVDTHEIPHTVHMHLLPNLFLVQPYLYPTPSLRTGGGFVVVPLALPSAGPPWTRSSCRPNQYLTASVPPPPSPPVSHGYSGLRLSAAAPTRNSTCLGIKEIHALMQ